MKTPRPIITQHNGIPHRVEWGFMLENTFFKTFEEHNQQIIEHNYHEVSQRVGSNYVDITDKKLGSSARVYFGVEQIHLRMPGTRYYVQRRVTPLISYSSPTGATAISAATAAVQQKGHQAATWMPSPPQNPRPSTSSPASLMYARRSNGVRSRESSSAASVSSTNSAIMTAATPSANNVGYMRNSSVRRSIRRYGKGNIKTNATTHQANHMQPSRSAKTISAYPTPLATATASPGVLDDFDWDIGPPRLVPKPSQDWPLSTSSSTPSPASPPPSPGLTIKNPMTAAYQQEGFPKTHHFAQPSHYQQQQQQYRHHNHRQPEIKAAFGTDDGYYQPTTAPLAAMPSSTANPTMNGNSIASTTVTTATNHIAAPAVIDSSYNNLTLSNLNDFDVFSALSMMSMPVSSQDPVHPTNQINLLSQQQMQQQQQQTSTFLNQLSLDAVAATAEQVSCPYWPWPMVPTTTTNMQQTFAAGTADSQSCNNIHTDAFHQLFADESQLTWYTNNQAGSLGFTYQS